jgi:hypothetical protein
LHYPVQCGGDRSRERYPLMETGQVFCIKKGILVFLKTTQANKNCSTFADNKFDEIW